MFVNGACSIYQHRPRTCRTYDCRVFPAAGVDPDAPAHARVAERARRWRFDVPTPEDEALQAAVGDAAGFLRDNASRLSLPASAARLAYLATRIHDLFLDGSVPALGAVEARLSAS